MTHLWLLLSLAFALSLDAFAVSVTCGAKVTCGGWRVALKLALTFGLFQMVMPLIGSLGGGVAAQVLGHWSRFIPAIIFAALAVKTLLDHFRPPGDVPDSSGCVCRSWRCVLTLGVATSIDALFAGLALGLLDVPLLLSAGIIGLVTFVLSLGGCFIGAKMSALLSQRARLLAGLILVGLAIKTALS
jgi:manganese efflux pump family protein